jgi:hypothetical protein
MLLNMLQPNSGDGSMKAKSKRWKEAWILADCMNIKVRLDILITISYSCELRRHFLLMLGLNWSALSILPVFRQRTYGINPTEQAPACVPTIFQ